MRHTLSSIGHESRSINVATTTERGKWHRDWTMTKSDTSLWRPCDQRVLSSPILWACTACVTVAAGYFIFRSDQKFGVWDLINMQNVKQRQTLIWDESIKPNHFNFREWERERERVYLLEKNTHGIKKQWKYYEQAARKDTVHHAGHLWYITSYI